MKEQEGNYVWLFISVSVCWLYLVAMTDVLWYMMALEVLGKRCNCNGHNLLINNASMLKQQRRVGVAGMGLLSCSATRAENVDAASQVTLSDNVIAHSQGAFVWYRMR